MSNLNKLAFAALLLCGAAGEASAQSREFFCSEKLSVIVKVIDARTVSVSPIKGKTVALKQNPQSPMSFVSAKVAIAIAKNEKSITLRQAGAADVKCVFPKPADSAVEDVDVADSSKPKPKSGSGKFKSFAAKSWGGIVRSGPGMEFDKVASLKEGDAITAIEQSKEMDGYFWYKIRFGSKNKTGYQWGGIICPVGKQVPGTFEQCD